MAKRTRSTSQQLKFGEPPLRGFVIHLAVFLVVIVALAAVNLLVSLGAFCLGHCPCRPRSRAADKVSTEK